MFGMLQETDVLFNRKKENRGNQKFLQNPTQWAQQAVELLYA